MVQNDVRESLGQSQEHLWRTDLAGGEHWLPALLIVCDGATLRQLRSLKVLGIRGSRRDHACILGKCSLVYG